MKKHVDLVSVMLVVIALAALLAHAKWGGGYGFSSGA
jgi:hypothetical protein